MKKCLVIVIITSAMFGCSGEDKTEYEMKKELMQMEMQHQREMARIQTSNAEYDYGQYSPDTPATNNHNAPPQQQYQSQPVADTYQESNPVYGEQQVDEGYGIGSMVLATGAGMLAGYAANEMLSNGMKSYVDDQGRTQYTDKSGKPVTKQQYSDYRKKNPTVTKLQDANAKAKQKVGETAVKTKEVVKKTATKVNNSKAMQKTKAAASNLKQKAQSRHTVSRSPSRSTSSRK